MQYVNPVIRGFYPDPSVCSANGKFYLVNSSFQYFPAVPLWESEDLINWKQIGHCLTRKSQVDLAGQGTNGGIYAPTIRYSNGTFYMVVTNVKGGNGNFYVTTDDIYGEWSEPVFVQRGGIDPSLFFDDDGKTYFLSNGKDDFGEDGISCGEIDLKTGKMLAKARCISKGCGGRYLEGPHLYKINGWYYLMVAEGGTEYGHMECILRSRNLYGPYEGYEKNPVLTNRNLGGYPVQGSGHADIVEGKNGQWWMVHLAFRQLTEYGQFHNLGRETFAEPVYWTDDGWFTVGADGTSRAHFEVTDGKCKILDEPEYPAYKWQLKKENAVYLRQPDFENYEIEKNACTLKASKDNLNGMGNNVFIAMRQTEHYGTMEVNADAGKMICGQSAGIAAYMDNLNHYDVNIEKTENAFVISSRFNVGGKCFEEKKISTDCSRVSLKITSTNESYTLWAKVENEGYVELGTGQSKYLCKEVTEGFTGVVLGLYTDADCNGKSGTVKFSW